MSQYFLTFCKTNQQSNYAEIILNSMHKIKRHRYLPSPFHMAVSCFHNNTKVNSQISIVPGFFSRKCTENIHSILYLKFSVKFSSSLIQIIVLNKIYQAVTSTSVLLVYITCNFLLNGFLFRLHFQLKSLLSPPIDLFVHLLVSTCFVLLFIPVFLFTVFNTDMCSENFWTCITPSNAN